MSFFKNLFSFKKNEPTIKEDKISFSEINNLLKNKFNQKPLESSCFNFNISNIKACVFEIEKVEIIKVNDNISEVFLVMNEITYGINFKIIAPLSEFRLLFKDFKFNPPSKPSKHKVVS